MLVAILVVFVIIAVLLIGLVLLQNEGGNGVGGIFGGSSSSVFGSRSGNVLSKATYILGILFFVLALMNKPDRSEDAGVLEAAGEESGIEQPASEDEDWFKKAPVESEGAEAPAASTGTLETDTVIVE